MIKAAELSKRYGKIEAVRGVSFSVQDNEVVGLLGPNGAGKTTTMRMLTTFLAPTSGTAQVAGYDVCKQASEVRKNIGYLPETPALYPEMKVLEYLNFIARIKGIGAKEISPAVDETIERCGLGLVSQRLCSNLSKGFRQRVGIAAAILGNPRVIILDEPTIGLDPAQIVEIRGMIRDLGKNHTVLLSTHILPEVVEICSRVIIIANGKVVVEGTLEELTKDRSLEESFLEAVVK